MAKAIKTALVAAAVTALTIVTLGAAGLAIPKVFVAAEGAGALGTFLATLSAPVQYAIMTAAGTLLSAGIGMLTSRGIEATAQNFGTKLTGRSAQAPRQIVYGKCRVAGTIVKMTTSGTLNNKLHLAAVIAGHEIQSLEKVYINDIELTTTSAVDGSGETVFTVTNTDFTNTDNDNSFGSGRLIRFTFHDGSQTAVDGLAAAALPSDYPSTAKFQGMAYVYMELIYDPEKNAQLPALWFEVKGKKVYDPRTASTAWSDNPALIIRDYLTDTLYGLKATSSEINDGTSAAVGNFYKAADICDETVSIPDANLTTYAVTVSGGKFYIDGVQQPTLNLKEGNTYKFDQSDSTNSSHPLRFSTTSNGTHGGGSQYTTGVTTNGTAGSSGAYTQITVATGAPTLYYYCTNHSGMGGTANTPSGSTETRYTANGFTNASASGEGILEGLLTSCAGSITYTNGKFNLFVGGDQTASLTITDEDVIGDISISTKSGSGELYNTVKSIFVDADSKYETMEAPVYENATYLAADTPSGESSANYKKIMELQFPFTVSQTMAQRLGAISLDRQRQTSTVSLLTTLEYMKLQPNDWVNVTNSRMSYSSKTFEVISTNLEFAENDGQIFAATRLTLQEIDTTIYDYDAGNYIDYVAEGVDTSGGSLGISAPTNLTLTQINGQEGTNAKISVKVSWTNNGNDAIQGTEIQYRLSTDGATDYKTAGFAGKGETSITFAGAIVGVQYYVRIRHFAFDNVLSAYTSAANITIAEPDTISAPTSVSASTGRVGAIDISFTAPAVESVSKVNIHYSTSSGFTVGSGNLLTSVAVGNGEVRKHGVGYVNGLSIDTTYYFKLTASNVYGTTSSASSEVSGNFIGLENGVVTSTKIASGAVGVAAFASSIEPVTIVSSVPSTKSTETIYNTTDNLLYRWNGTQYVSAVGATDFSELTGTIDTADISDAAVTAAKIGAAAVEAAKIANNAVTTDKINALAVTEAKVAASAITTAKIAAAAVAAGNLATSAVTSDKINALAVTEAKVAANAITTGKIADLAISSGKLADAAATEAKIATDAITTTKISDDAITTAKIAAGAVTASEITAGTITASQIATGTITATEIATGTITASEIATGTITASEIATGTITANEIATNAVTAVKIAAGAVTAGKVAAGAIDTAELAAGAITTAKIDALAITASEIAADAITSAKILAGAVTADEISSNAVTSAKILAGAVVAGKIGAGAVDTAELNAGAVTTDKLGALAVTAAKIAANTITASQIASNTITANEILGNTITANEIAANTITGGQIAAAAISASEIAANALDVAKISSGGSKEYSTNSNTGADFKFEFGTNTTVAGYQGAGILRSGISTSFGVAGLSNATDSVAVAGQQATNASDAYGSYFANSNALGSTNHRTQAGLCNNTRAAIFADNATTTNYAYVCNGTYALQTTGDVYVDGDITATGTISPFTGMHDGLMADTDTPAVGDILVDSSVAAKKDISNTLFVMASSSSTNQSAIGIYAGDRGADYIPVAIAEHGEVATIHETGAPTVDSAHSSILTGRKVVVVNSLGEGQVNVCGEGGDIAAGDLIVTSSTAGKGMKQSDDILRGYTVAKARESITFANASDTGQIACIYLCG